MLSGSVYLWRKKRKEGMGAEGRKRIESKEKQPEEEGQISHEK